jgi:hypothetical protein
MGSRIGPNPQFESFEARTRTPMLRFAANIGGGRIKRLFSGATIPPARSASLGHENLRILCDVS